MTIITAKQNGFENPGNVTDWMASFLDSQISKLEEPSEDVPAEKLPKTTQEPIWN